MNRRALLLAGAAQVASAAACDREAPRAERDDPADAKSSGAGSASSVADSKPWLVGAFLPLTGPDARYGDEARKGIELAVAELNAAGGARGAPLKVLFEDDKSSVSEVVSKVNQLIDRDKVCALIGEVASSRTLPAAAIATQKRVPIITPCATHVDVTRGQPFAFRACFIDAVQGRAAAEFAVAVQKKTKLGLVFVEDDAYSATLAGELRKAVAARGASVVAEVKLTQRETSFAAHTKALKAAAVELVYAPIYFRQMIAFARAARAEGLAPDMFLGGDGWSGEDELYQELEGAHFTDHYVADLPWPRSRKLVETFKAAHGKPPTSIVATSHDAVLMLADALGRATSDSGPALRDALAATRDVAGATGPISIDGERNADKAVVVVQIRGKSPRYATVVGTGAQAILAMPP